jgi:hypothetical protein
VPRGQRGAHDEFAHERRIVVLEPLSAFRVERADVHALVDRDLDGAVAGPAVDEQPDVEQLAVGVDAESAGGPVLGGAAVDAAAYDRGQAEFAHHPQCFYIRQLSFLF